MKSRHYARPRPVPGQMNKTEKLYAGHLELLKKADEIKDYRFEPLNLRLAKNTFYRPDFLVITQFIEFHEVKGHWEDDARVKIKVAAELFPWFRFIAVQYEKKQWITEAF